MTINYERFNKWRKKHPKIHKLRVLHYTRISRGFYNNLPLLIKNMQKELKAHLKGVVTVNYITEYKRAERGYYRKLPAKIKRYKKILNDYKRGRLPKN
jgi:hypothetical protein